MLVHRTLTKFVVLNLSLILTGCSAGSDGKNTAEDIQQIIVQDNIVTNNKADKSVSNLTEMDIKKLVEFWENAQDAGDFEGYQSCYTKPFKGVKTVSKSSREYDYTEWMNDRRKMLGKAVGLDVAIKNLQISVDGEVATVEFDQYYRSKNYSDWGPKVLKIKQTADGAKIVYELLKESHPL